MKVERIREITIDGITYHLARNITVWRAEIHKRYPQYPRDWPCHHVFGRNGILKLLIENGVPIPPDIHIHEKSTNPMLRGEVIECALFRLAGDLRRRLQAIAEYEWANAGDLAYQLRSGPAKL